MTSIRSIRKRGQKQMFKTIGLRKARSAEWWWQLMRQWADSGPMTICIPYLDKT